MRRSLIDATALRFGLARLRPGHGRSAVSPGRWAVVLAVSFGVATVGSIPVAGTSVAFAASSAPPCVTTAAPTTVLNTAETAQLASGTTTTVAVPSSVPADALAVLLQVRTSGTRAGTLTIAPLGGGGVLAASVLAKKWSSSTAMIDSPGSALSITYTSAKKGGLLSATIELTAFIPATQCFTPVPQTPAVDTSTGAGLPSVGPLAAGSQTPVNLNVGETIPASSGARPVTIRVAAGATPTTVTLSDGTPTPTPILSWTVPANASMVDTRVLPAGGGGQYEIGVTGGPANVSLTPAGWFADSNAYAISNDLLLDTTMGVGAKKAKLKAGQTLVLKLPSDIPSAAGVVLGLTAKTAGASLYVWPTSGERPAVPDVSFASGRTGYNQVLVQPGTEGTVSIQVARGSLNLQAVAVGWVPIPPPPNEPVAGVVTVPAPEQVSTVTPNPETGEESVVYHGANRLNVGDVVVLDTSEEQPEGYLGVVTATEPASGAMRRARSALSSADVTPQSTPETQTVTLRQGSLTEAVPSAEFESPTLETASAEPPPDEAPELPADSPPGTFEEPPTPEEPALSGFARPMATTGGALPSQANFSCSAGVGAQITASLRLSAGVDISGSWSPWSGVTANFGVSGSVNGSVALNVNAGASCSYSRTLPGPSLPSLRFFIGPVPVIVDPKLSMDVSASGAVDGALRASGSANLGLQTGVHYSHGSFSPYFTPSASFPISVGARANASISASVKPRLDLALYGIAGPFAEIGAKAGAYVSLGANPWWSASAALVGDVGFAINVFGVHKTYAAPEHTFASFKAGSAGGPYPGATVTTTSLPGGEVGSGYGAQLGATGGAPPYRWYLVSGALPAGLSLNTNGTISGTPTTVQTAGFTVRAIDSAGNRTGSDQGLSITIAPHKTEEPPSPSITASKGGKEAGNEYYLNIQVHNFPTGTYRYDCYDNEHGSFQSFYHNTVTVTNPNQSSWPGAFCWDNSPYVAYLVMDGYRSNSVQF